MGQKGDHELGRVVRAAYMKKPGGDGPGGPVGREKSLREEESG
jgi:hypothetical protein